jgi:transposase
MKLTDKQWHCIADLFDDSSQDLKVGRPATPAREVLNGVLWILKTGARWKDLPRDYPPYQTCHRRFQHWVRDGTMEAALQRIAKDLHDRGGIDISEAFIDGTFSSAKKGVFLLARRNAARGPRSWPLRTLMVFLSRYALRALHPTKSR